MNDEQVKKLKERVNDLDKITRNLTMEVQTIDVLIAHMLSDVASKDDIRLRAAEAIGQTIQNITQVYR